MVTAPPEMKKIKMNISKDLFTDIPTYLLLRIENAFNVLCAMILSPKNSLF